MPVYDAGSDGSHHYITSTFIAGRTLAGVINDNEKRLDAAQIVLNLAEALNSAHGRGT